MDEIESVYIKEAKSIKSMIRKSQIINLFEIILMILVTCICIIKVQDHWIWIAGGLFASWRGFSYFNSYMLARNLYKNISHILDIAHDIIKTGVQSAIDRLDLLALQHNSRVANGLDYDTSFERMQREIKELRDATRASVIHKEEGDSSLS